MYGKSMVLARNGNLGASLPPPRLDYERQEVKVDSYMLCEFMNVTDDDIHYRWLSLYKTFKVCGLLSLTYLLRSVISDMYLTRN